MLLQGWQTSNLDPDAYLASQQRSRRVRLSAALVAGGAAFTALYWWCYATLLGAALAFLPAVVSQGAAALALLVWMAASVVLGAGGWREVERATADADRRGRRTIAVRALRYLYANGEHEEIIAVLKRVIPVWEVRDSLIKTVNELFILRDKLPLARDAGVPPSVIERLAEDAAQACAALWDEAERLAAVGKQEINTVGVQELLRAEAAKLDRIRQACERAREGLAAIILSPRSAQTFGDIETRFQSVAVVARTLADDEAGSIDPLPLLIS